MIGEGGERERESNNVENAREVEKSKGEREDRLCLCLVGEVSSLNLLDVGGLSAELELLSIVALFLGSVGSP